MPVKWGRNMFKTDLNQQPADSIAGSPEGRSDEERAHTTPIVSDDNGDILLPVLSVGGSIHGPDHLGCDIRDYVFSSL